MPVEDASTTLHNKKKHQMIHVQNQWPILSYSQDYYRQNKYSIREGVSLPKAPSLFGKDEPPAPR